jgi:anti-sigma B factor antagonist
MSNSIECPDGVSGVRVESRREGEVTVLSVFGDIDLSSAGELGAHVSAALAARPPILLVDLTAVEFMASAGLQVLVDTYRTATRTRVAVVAAGLATRRPITVTGLHHVMELYPSLGKALAELQSA